MATFGSFCLLIALVLAAYNLFAGAVALRLIATGQPARISPERLADTARRAGIAGFCGRNRRRFCAASIRSLPTTSPSPTSLSTPTARCPFPTSLRRCGAARRVRCCCGRGCWALTALFCGCAHKTDVKLYAYAGTILSGIQVFFLPVLVFAAPPFSLLRGAIPG